MSSFQTTRPVTAMSFSPGSRQSKFMRHEEKQENLSRFCGYFLDRLSVQETPSAVECRVTLLARSPQSPVARAVLDAQAEFASLNVTMQVMFAKLDPAESLTGWFDFAEQVAGPATVDLRWARRPALIDAHEQLVLGLGLSWAGDCMRREPEKRDAYEQFDTFDCDAAARAQVSFASFWSMSERLSTRRLSMASAIHAEQSVHDALLGQPQTHFASTRH
jgi:hypothetical protein